MEIILGKARGRQGRGEGEQKIFFSIDKRKKMEKVHQREREGGGGTKQEKGKIVNM